MSDTTDTLVATPSNAPRVDLALDEAIRIARSLRATLIEEQAAVEQRTTYSPQTHQTFKDAGFYRLLVPKAYGGYAWTMPDFVRLMGEVARGCMSTGWGLCLGASHALLVSSLWPKSVQDAVFADDGHVVIPSTARPGGPAVRVGDGWALNTTHPYSSGSPYSTHYVGQAFEYGPDGGAPVQQLLFVAPRSAYEIKDDWGHTLGLKGSGSNTIVFHDSVIPADHVLEGTMQVDLRSTNMSPGFELHGNPMHLAPGQGFFGLDLSAVFIGGAFGMLDEYERLMRERKTAGDAGRAPAARMHDADYQRWFGLASARLNAAQAIVFDTAARWMELCQRAADGGEPFGTADDMMLNMMCREATRLAWSTVQDTIYRTAGSSASVNGERMERSYRDLSQAWGHVNMIIEDSMARAWTTQALS
jgi:3-hydroxy-9,10-secoandrosta-1,3,5(10)-triene-9,17-dione monooxygenase